MRRPHTVGNFENLLILTFRNFQPYSDIASIDTRQWRVSKETTFKYNDELGSWDHRNHPPLPDRAPARWEQGTGSRSGLVTSDESPLADNDHCQMERKVKSDGCSGQGFVLKKERKNMQKYGFCDSWVRDFQKSSFLWNLYFLTPTLVLVEYTMVFNYHKNIGKKQNSAFFRLLSKNGCF